MCGQQVNTKINKYVQHFCQWHMHMINRNHFCLNAFWFDFMVGVRWRKKKKKIRWNCTFELFVYFFIQFENTHTREKTLIFFLCTRHSGSRCSIIPDWLSFNVYAEYTRHQCLFICMRMKRKKILTRVADGYDSVHFVIHQSVIDPKQILQIILFYITQFSYSFLIGFFFSFCSYNIWTSARNGITFSFFASMKKAKLSQTVGHRGQTRATATEPLAYFLWQLYVCDWSNTIYFIVIIVVWSPMLVSYACM